MRSAGTKVQLHLPSLYHSILTPACSVRNSEEGVDRKCWHEDSLLCAAELPNYSSTIRIKANNKDAVKKRDRGGWKRKEGRKKERKF